MVRLIMLSREPAATMPAAMQRNLAHGHPGGIFTPCDWQAPGQTIPACFAEMVDRFPDRLATCDFARRLMCGELDRAANRVANVLLATGGGSPNLHTCPHRPPK